MNQPIDIESLTSGNLLALSRAITLIESRKPDHRLSAMKLVNDVYARRTPSIRIGITGIPGVGKSTFIEQLGQTIIAAGHKLAVLAVDPSSTKSRGSILGDKTRMDELSRNKNAFIRPSPSGGTLGGVASRTREAMLLCEAAGFDVIIVETVGVGQSETEVINITDCFLMLAMPGTGDDLQGIKRGIMEAADIIVINKADGANADAARKAKKQLEMALHLFPDSGTGWSTKVLTASALKNVGVNEAWASITNMISTVKDTGNFELRRNQQQQRAFEKLTELGIYEFVMDKIGSSATTEALREKIALGKMNEFEAAMKTMQSLKELGFKN